MPIFELQISTAKLCVPFLPCCNSKNAETKRIYSEIKTLLWMFSQRNLLIFTIVIAVFIKTYVQFRLLVTETSNCFWSFYWFFILRDSLEIKALCPLVIFTSHFMPFLSNDIANISEHNRYSFIDFAFNYCACALSMAKTQLKLKKKRKKTRTFERVIERRKMCIMTPDYD